MHNFLSSKYKFSQKLQDNECMLKRHGNETDFYIFFIYKSFWQGSLTQLLKPFLIQIRGDICKKKMTPRYQRYKESPTLLISITESRKKSPIM
jgi:hypothetical protein